MALLREGQVFAGFVILGPLGTGGMGEVYLATHPRLPRPEALKVLSAEASVDDAYRQRFNREADLAARLFHPNIVGVHDRGEFNGQLWISMDYIAGTDVARLVRSRYPGGMPAKQAVEIVSAVAASLDYAHQSGLLHRDVKPANVLLADPETPAQRIFLADFGIARQMAGDSNLTSTGMMVGTMSYGSPEQMAGDPLDGRADQYSLACSAYFMLTGTAPFTGPTPAAIVTQHLQSPPPPIAQRRPELAAMDAVFARALAKDPRARYATCADFAHDLARRLPSPVGGTVPGPDDATWVANRPMPRPQFVPQFAPQQRPPQQGTSRRGLVIACAVVGVVAVVCATIVAVVLTGDDNATAGPTSTLIDAPGRSATTTTRSSSESSDSSDSSDSSERRTNTAPPAPIRPPVAFTVAGQPRDIGTDVACENTGGELQATIGDPLNAGVAVTLTTGPNPIVKSVLLGLVDGVRLSYSGDRGKAFASTDDGKNFGIVGDAFGVDPVNPSQTVQKYFELGFVCP